MSYKNKSRSVEVCIMDFGAGAKCYFSSEECAYRKNIRDCSYYQANFMPEDEREKIRVRGLVNLVNGLKLNGNGKFKK